MMTINILKKMVERIKEFIKEHKTAVAITGAAAGLATGLPGHITAELANLGAGIVVGTLGTATVTAAELIDAARHHG